MPRPASISTIKRLQTRYLQAEEQARQQYETTVNYCRERRALLNDYERELAKPGFKYGERIVMGVGKELFVVGAGETT